MWLLKIKWKGVLMQPTSQSVLEFTFFVLQKQMYFILQINENRYFCTLSLFNFPFPFSFYLSILRHLSCTVEGSSRVTAPTLQTLFRLE